MKPMRLFMTTVIAGILAQSSTAFAANWTDPLVLNSVYLRPASGAGTAPELQLKLAGTATWGSGCASSTVVRTADDRLQDHYLSMALAAYLAGKPIQIYTDSTCVIQRMTF